MRKKTGPKKKLSDIEEKEVYDLWLKRTPLTEIGYKYNISLSTIQRTIKRIKKEEK